MDAWSEAPLTVGFTRASDDILKTRRIVRVKRPVEAEADGPHRKQETPAEEGHAHPFAHISLIPKETPKDNNEEDENKKDSNEVDENKKEKDKNKDTDTPKPPRPTTFGAPFTAFSFSSLSTFGNTNMNTQTNLNTSTHTTTSYHKNTRSTLFAALQQPKHKDVQDSHKDDEDQSETDNDDDDNTADNGIDSNDSTTAALPSNYTTISNGEEQEQCIYQGRAKLFKLSNSPLVSSPVDWKELGLGPLRLLRRVTHNSTTQQLRIVQRRESTPGGPGTKLLLNAWIRTECRVQRLSEKFVQLIAFEPERVQYLFKLKTVLEADALMEAIQNAIDACASKDEDSGNSLPLEEDSGNAVPLDNAKDALP